MAQILDYQPSSPRNRRRAARLHFAVVVAATLLFLLVAGLLFHPLYPKFDFQEYLGGGIIGTPAAPITYDDAQKFDQPIYAVQAIAYLLILIITQWIMVQRLTRWKLNELGGGKLSPGAAVLLGLPAMLLSIGLLATLMEIPNWWLAWTEPYPEASHRQDFLIVWIGMALVWLAWAILFWIYGRNRERTTAAGKILRGLLAGSILETFVAAAAHTWVMRTRGSDCYCTLGSYTGMVFGLTVLVWLFGPGTWFLLQYEKRRMQQLL